MRISKDRRLYFYITWDGLISGEPLEADFNDVKKVLKIQAIMGEPISGFNWHETVVGSRSFQGADTYFKLKDKYEKR